MTDPPGNRRLEGMLPADEQPARVEPALAVAAGSIPDNLPRHLRDRLTEPVGPDRSAQTAALVLSAIEWGLDDGQVVALALAHPPTRDKYGARADREAARLLTKHRPDHPHVGRPCDKAGCASAPPWMTGSPAPLSAASGNGHRPPVEDDVPHPADTPALEVPRKGSVRPFPTIDLAALAEQGIPPPTLVCGDLLYRGALHSLAGPPDSGKSTLLYLWMLQLLAQEQPVVLLDEESGREQVTEKLLALGGEPRHLRHLSYVEFPSRQWDNADRQGLTALLDDVRPALVGFDSSAAFLAVAGKDEDRAPDVTGFYKGVLLTAARAHNSAIVILDHIAKNTEGGTRYARGSGAKLATVDVAFMLDPVTPFSRAQAGLLKLKVTKDRRGYLHRDFEVRVEVEDGQMAVAVTEAGTGEAQAGRRDLTHAAKKLLAVLELADEPLTNRELVDGVVERFGHGLTRETVSRELNSLAAESLVDHLEEGRQKRWFVPLKGGSDV